MFTFGRDSFSPANHSACGRCGRMVMEMHNLVGNNWQQNNWWWRASTPAVPFASVFDRKIPG